MKYKIMGNLILSILFISIISSCTSYETLRQQTEEIEVPTRVYDADFEKVWNITKGILSHYAIDIENKNSGLIKTIWNNNTLEMNFADSFGSNDMVKAAEFKLVINVVKGFRGKKEVTRVSIYKRQRIEQDFLQGWKIIRSDGVMENSMLYRIERKIDIDKKLQRIEAMRIKEQLENYNNAPTSTTK